MDGKRKCDAGAIDAEIGLLVSVVLASLRKGLSNSSLCETAASVEKAFGFLGVVAVVGFLALLAESGD